MPPMLPGLLAAVALWTVAFSPTATAQTAVPPEALQAAHELAALIDKDSVNILTGRLLTALWPQQEQQLRAGYPKLDEATLAELRGAFAGALRTNVAEVTKAKPMIYARHFSAQELRELIAFYRTRTGEKVLQELPQVTDETLQSMLPRLQTAQGEAMQLAQQILERQGYR